MKKIVLILPYFGKWPVWFPAFLQSCRYNPMVNWLLFTDCEKVYYPQSNVKFISFTIQDFCQLASKKLGLNINFSNPYKLCDFKPAYGFIFEDYLDGYDFWGYCDADIVFGDIQSFLTDELLDKYDVLTTTPIVERLAGHFTIYRNQPQLRTLFQENPMYKIQYEKIKYTGYDEGKMGHLVKNFTNAGKIRGYWPQKCLLNFANPQNDREMYSESHLSDYTNRWHWQQGKMYDKYSEVMYLHFMTWKKSLNKCYFTYQDDPKSFYISYSHIGDKYAWPPLKSVLAHYKSKIMSISPLKTLRKSV